MKPISTSELGALEYDFSESREESAKHFRSQSKKIGWMRVEADSPGAKFDIFIKDALGRTKYQALGCDMRDGSQYGELVNLETQLGEDLDVVISNVSGAKKVNVFLN